MRGYQCVAYFFGGPSSRTRSPTWAVRTAVYAVATPLAGRSRAKSGGVATAWRVSSSAAALSAIGILLVRGPHPLGPDKAQDVAGGKESGLRRTQQVRIDGPALVSRAPPHE